MKNKWLAAPYVVWMAIFVVAPLILVVIFAFTSKSGGGVTLENFSNMATYIPAFEHSFALAIAATVICILIGYPLAYFLSREKLMVRKVAMMLIMLPMWMNFLLRTYAWMSILDDNGLINQFLANIGFFNLINGMFGTNIQYIHMINTQGAIVLGMVYNFLPFMVLPIFSVIDKIDHRVIEAAQDLGADGTMVFRKVIFPLSLPGVLSGVTMVFIPSVSTFALSRLLGGGKTLLLGDLIEMQFLGNAYNPHLGSAIALVMMVIVLVMMAVMNRFGEGEEGVAVL
ncbi:ABC transporter permease [Intestinimonas massiliensis (ex Afouda et al. 2020)]|uniref:ABC transporter permease n=1 Tax=Intestinimonas massiliensis (ex Afouda et al. 2020) TaxID=1673721 RepID=UPI00103223E5|nr:ABC transporter permease [Intestinimonas massiliensis (ex Afouda et al. 2020)]